MIRTIARIGNSLALIFDTALRELTGLQEGDAVDVTLRQDGCVVITPLPRAISTADAATAARNLIECNASLFERLSKEPRRPNAAPCATSHSAPMQSPC